MEISPVHNSCRGVLTGLCAVGLAPFNLAIRAGNTSYAAGEGVGLYIPP
jgi:hypothetical protein